jgi:hypothetical protein
MSKTFLWFAAGVFAGIALNNQISGIVNPLLTPLKLSASLS